MAAALGNNYAAKDKVWARAIKRALEKRSKSDQLEALDELAEKLLSNCDAGDMQALKELGDRLDGKSTQQTELSGPDGGAIPMKTVVNFVAGGS